MVIVHGVEIDGTARITRDIIVLSYLYAKEQDTRVDEKDAYVSEIWRAWKEFCIKRGIGVGTDSAIRNVIKRLSDGGLIEFTRSVTIGEKVNMPRRYYKLTNEGRAFIKKQDEIPL